MLYESEFTDSSRVEGTFVVYRQADSSLFVYAVRQLKEQQRQLEKKTRLAKHKLKETLRKLRDVQD